MLTRYQPYALVLTIQFPEPYRLFDDLITFLLAAPDDSPIKQCCAVDQEHSERYPRPKVRIGGGNWTVEFVVPEPETYETLLAKLKPLFETGGWAIARADTVPTT